MALLRRLFFDPRLSRWTAWAVPVILIASWQFLAEAHLISTRILPAPTGVLEAAWKLAKTGELEQDVWVSTQRALIAFALGGSIGLALGIFTGVSRVGEILFDTTIQMVRNLPLLALIPIVILWFGIGEEAKILLVAISVFCPIYLNTFHGIRSVDPGLIEMARIYGFGPRQLLWNVLLRGAMPTILLGVRYALGFMWLFLVVAETISATSGIGYMAMDAREFVHTDIVLVSILLYALLGKLTDVIAKLLERLLLPWHHTQLAPKDDALNYGFF